MVVIYGNKYTIHLLLEVCANQNATYMEENVLWLVSQRRFKEREWGESRILPSVVELLVNFGAD